MGSILYIVALLLVMAWLIAFVGFDAGGIIHMFLLIAAFAVLLRVTQGRKAL
jgi:hypothetical protein